MFELGLYCIHHNSPRSLVLEHVSATVDLKDLVARVTLAQTYKNDLNFLIDEGKYAFPIPDRAAVSSFTLVKEDGKRVVGIVQEKEEAKATYDAAVREGNMASLMDQQTADGKGFSSCSSAGVKRNLTLTLSFSTVFQVSLGNILPNETVTIELSYVTEVTEDETIDSIRLHVPAHISARYGAPPLSLDSTISSSKAFLSLRVNVESTSSITKIGCPSHSVETELGPDPSLPNFKDLPFSNYARVSLFSQTSLDKDFVLTIKSASIDYPRCILERHPDEKRDTVALALTMVPRFQSSVDLAKQEFVFLVDRSGSMEGDRIKMAKQALVIMLRSLPRKDCVFNIVSFGSSHSKLWPQSKTYDQKSLEDATAHVDLFRADFGGTEIRSALEDVYKSRRTDRPTSVFLLTDGDVWALDETLKVVKDATKNDKADAYVRTYSLGIGNSASTALVEGVARSGNGTSSFVSDGEAMSGKIARLLKAARTPQITNVKVNWGVKESSEAEILADDEFEVVSRADTMVDTAAATDATKQTISLFNSNVDPLSPTSDEPFPTPPSIQLPPFATIQQSPSTVHTLAPGTRFTLYSILRIPRDSPLPKYVAISGSIDSLNSFNEIIPIVSSQLSDNSLPPPVHTMAAKKLIQDLEDQRVDFECIVDDQDICKRTMNAAIVRLATLYGLASSQTSFVAVDESEKDQRKKEKMRAVPQVIVAQADFAFAAVGGGVPLLSSGPPRTRSTRGIGMSGLFGGRQSKLFGAPPPGGAPDLSATPSPPKYGTASIAAKATPGGMFNNFLVKAKKSAVPSPPPPPPGAAAPVHAMATTFASQSISANYDKESAKLSIPTGESTELDKIARLQAFDGSFSVGVLAACGIKATLKEIVSALSNWKVESDVVAATVVALVYLQREMGAEKESWEAIFEKGVEYVAEELKMDSARVQQMVKEIESSIH